MSAFRQKQTSAVVIWPSNSRGRLSSLFPTT